MILVLGAAVLGVATAAVHRGRAARGEAALAPAGAPAPAVLPPVAWHRLRILIVDDEPRVGQMIARLMTGHEITTVTSGEAALATLALDDRFDAILCDLVMPGMSGPELADAVAERHRDVRARMVFLTSDPSTPAARQFLTRSEARWVTKPVRYAQLATCISEVAAAYRSSTTVPSARSVAATCPAPGGNVSS